MERTMQEKEELEMDHCEETEVHEELLRIVQEKLPKEEELYDLAELYKVFGDSTRIRILFVLFECGGLCLRPCSSPAMTAVGDFPSAACFKTE